jgi:hypothetical protein
MELKYGIRNFRTTEKVAEGVGRPEWDYTYKSTGETVKHRQWKPREEEVGLGTK